MKVPSGATWKVELLKHKDEVSFAKGWEKFIAYYSIDYGDFLVFEYQGNSLFNVFIIDKSFTEVGDPWNNTDAAESNQEDKLEDHEDDDDDDDDDASVEFIDISSGSQETGKGTKGKEN
ncbi:B3 domain-containing transcription factor VRN1-like [Populus alba x Populus x berolinensis]|nr:B3 domain-containing transcription factor VRN1-like [Populus alba x Populus x berolinensis]